MARKQIVNGKVYDWSSVTIGMSGCGGIEPKEISYDDEKEKTLIYGRAAGSADTAQARQRTP